MKSFCRELDCRMSFATPRHRDQHEGLMHKDMVKQAAIKLVDKICNSNTNEALKKKVLRTPKGVFSYAEAQSLIQQDSDDGKAVLDTMKNVVETYFAHHQEFGVRELLGVSEFKIQ